MNATRTKAIFVSGLSLALGLFVTVGAFAGPIFQPDTMNLSFQARLTDDQGDPLSDGTVDLVFMIWDPIVGPIEGPISLMGVPIANGVVNVQVPISRTSFDGYGRELGVRVNGGPEMSPRLPLVSVPHALRVDRVENPELTNNVVLGDEGQPGTLTALRSDATTSVRIDGAAGEIKTLDPASQTRFQVNQDGTLQLSDAAGNLAGRMTASAEFQLNTPGTGFPSIYASGSTGVVSAPTAFQIYSFQSEQYRGGIANGINTGAYIELFDNEGGKVLAGGGRISDGGYLDLLRDDGQKGLALQGQSFGGGGEVSVYNGLGAVVVTLSDDFNDNGFMHFKDAAGNAAITLRGDSVAGSGEIGIFGEDGTETITLMGAEDPGQGAEIRLKNANGNTSIVLDADMNGESRIITDVLQINGGADLSEQFDVSTDGSKVEPGMVVSINPDKPGELRMSTQAYDRTVAGIISGAGGVATGMLMGQKGSIADGQHAVALTGRVYCMCDASTGAIKPGDLLTTSDVAGHAMKVEDHTRAAGAIIGKAMTGLDEGRGLVLVLVSLQ